MQWFTGAGHSGGRERGKQARAAKQSCGPSWRSASAESLGALEDELQDRGSPTLTWQVGPPFIASCGSVIVDHVCGLLLSQTPSDQGNSPEKEAVNINRSWRVGAQAALEIQVRCQQHLLHNSPHHISCAVHQQIRSALSLSLSGCSIVTGGHQMSPLLPGPSFHCLLPRPTHDLLPS